MDACARCGVPAAAEARFCAACGAVLSQVIEAPPVRKHVVVIFVDIVGSTALGERLDPEPLRRYIKRYFDTVSAVLWRHGGTVEKFIGDAVMAVFGVPVSREDDAARAVRAAAQLHVEVAALSADLEREYQQRLRVRIGINGGEVFVARNMDGQFSVTGDAVNTAARLEQAAGPGETLVGGTVADLAAGTLPLVPVPPLTVKGKAAALPAWRVDAVPASAATGAVRAAAAQPRAQTVGLVGRHEELADLRRVADRVASRSTSCLVTVLGSAGIGKSRLLAEFAGGLEGWRVLEGSCPSYPAGSTFWPLSLMLEQLGADWPAQVALLLRGDRDGERDAPLVVDRLATALGTSDHGTSLDDIGWAARRLVETLSADRPVLLTFEDLHWASPTFLEFVDRLCARLRSVPVLVVCVARPELLEAYPMWGGGRSFATTVQLDPLPPEAVRELVSVCAPDVVAHGADLELVDRVSSLSEGNPLIVQQLLRSADGGLPASLPASLATLFQARLDRLDPADRVLCQCAAVMGREFWIEAACVAADLGEGAGDLQSTLDRLERMDVVERTRARNGGRPDHRFTHSLLMESVYRATPKSHRSRAHSRVADWLDTAPGLSPGERSELVAHHRERAHTMLFEISPGDPDVSRLGGAAGAAMVAASGHCMARSDLPAAIRLLEHAQRLLPAADRRQHDVARWLFDCHMARGALTEAAVALDRTDEVLHQDPLWTLLGPVPRAVLDLRLERTDRATAHRVARTVIETPGADPGALLWAHELAALAFSLDMEMVPAQSSARAALDYARAAGDRRAAGRLLCGLCEMAFWGPTPVAEARALCQDSLAGSGSDLRLSAPVLAILAALHALEGDHDPARDILRRANDICADLDAPGLRAGIRQYGHVVLALRGEHDAAARECLTAAAELAADDPAATLLRLMAVRAMLDAGDDIAARGLLAGLAPPPAQSEPHYQGLWYGLAARLAPADREQAVAWATRAVAVTAAMQSPRSHGDALLDLALVRRAHGDGAGYRSAATAAREQYLRKGATALASTVDIDAPGEAV